MTKQQTNWSPYDNNGGGLVPHILVSSHRGSNDEIASFYEFLAKLDELLVSVYPQDIQPENPNSYRARKREYFRMRRERKKATAEEAVVQTQLVLAFADDAESTNPLC